MKPFSTGTNGVVKIFYYFFYYGIIISSMRLACVRATQVAYATWLMF